MTVWRPQHSIQVKALGLVWRQGRLLASEITRDDGTVKGVRPLGGRVEFGETWSVALVREFQEELGVHVEPTGAPLFLENIYAHQGSTGHEIVILSELLFPPEAYQGCETIEYREDNGELCRAGWFDVETLDCGGLELYPNGLKQWLQRQTGAL